MKQILVDDFEEQSKAMLETLEGKNLNFLIGAGASMPYLKALGLPKTTLTFEDIYEEASTNDAYECSYDYLSACFIYNSIIKGTYNNINNGNNVCKIIQKNYITFLNNIYRILSCNSIQQPKRANIFTTNYDMFFETAFDFIARSNSDINFNDGSYGFVKKTISTSRFHTKVTRVGVDSKYEFEVPMLNLLKLHGSLNWIIDNDDNLCIDNEVLRNTEFYDDEIKEIEMLDSITTGNTIREILENIEEQIQEDGYSRFAKKLDSLTIVKPSKKKFSKTVMEEHYYQMLRIFSQELERKQSVLIVFGFSFADEHIQSILKRSLSNPNLLVYIFCFNESDLDKFSKMFVNYKNIQLIYRKDKASGDFTFFNTMLGGI